MSVPAAATTFAVAMARCPAITPAAPLTVHDACHTFIWPECGARRSAACAQPPKPRSNSCLPPVSVQSWKIRARHAGAPRQKAAE